MTKIVFPILKTADSTLVDVVHGPLTVFDALIHVFTFTNVPYMSTDHEIKTIGGQTLATKGFDPQENYYITHPGVILAILVGIVIMIIIPIWLMFVGVAFTILMYEKYKNGKKITPTWIILYSISGPFYVFRYFFQKIFWRYF